MGRKKRLLKRHRRLGNLGPKLEKKFSGLIQAKSAEKETKEPEITPNNTPEVAPIDRQPAEEVTVTKEESAVETPLDIEILTTKDLAEESDSDVIVIKNKTEEKKAPRRARKPAPEPQLQQVEVEKPKAKRKPRTASKTRTKAPSKPRAKTTTRRKTTKTKKD